MAPDNSLKFDNSVASDSNKTEQLITGGKPFKHKNPIPDNNLTAKAESMKEDNTKTIISLAAPEPGYRVKVVGPFNGEIEALAGMPLKDVLRFLNNDTNTFGQFKYRDEQDNPVNTKAGVERDMVLTSILRA